MGLLDVISYMFTYSRRVELEDIRNYTMVIMDPDMIDIEKGLYDQ